LYSSKIPFEELSGLCRCIETRESIKCIQYLIFDMILLNDLNEGFQSRIGRLMFSDDDVIQIVPTHQCTSIDDIMEFHGSFVAAGYEGTIIRNRDGVYRMGYRSWDLQKYKTFMEEEFPIIGFTEGHGREKGTVVWQCATLDGRTFHVRPRGSMEHRTAMFKDADSYLGRPLTVIFQEYTSEGIPRFPVGKAIRSE
jgi:ATP-dependent DNA ligase